MKRRQDIASKIAEFLDVVSDMNNPQIQEVSVRIEEKLYRRGLLGREPKEAKLNGDLFAELGIKKTYLNVEPTDLEIDEFVKICFEQIVTLQSKLCEQYEKDNLEIQVVAEKIDQRTELYQFYNNGTLVRGIKISLNKMFSRNESIYISDCTMSFLRSNNSWNEMYGARVINGELRLFATMALCNRNTGMTVEEVVTDIWENHIRI